MVSSVVGLCLFGDSLLYAVLPANLAAFGVGTASVGLILSANRFIRLVSNSLAGNVYNRMGLRLPLTLAVVGTVVSTAAYGLVTGVWPLLLARFLWGVCFSFLRLGGYLVVLEESTDRNRGQFMGLFNATWRVGSLIGVAIGGLLTDVIGIRLTFVSFAALSGLGVFVALRVPTHSSVIQPAIVSRTRPGDGLPAVDSDRHEGWLRRKVWALVAGDMPRDSYHRRLPIVTVGFTRFAIALTMQGLVVATLGFYLRQQLGDGLQMLGVLIGVTTLTGVLLGSRWLVDIGLSTSLGQMSDRFGRSKELSVALLVLIVVLVVLAQSPTPALVIVALPILFVAFTAGGVTLDSAAGDLAPKERRAQVMSRYATWGDLGSALGPVLGFLMLTTVDLPVVYLVAAALLLAALALYSWVFRSSLVARPTSR